MIHENYIKKDAGKYYGEQEIMKIAVITRHAITNYGSLLQALATQVTIEKLGYECEIVNYIRKDESYKNHEKTLLKRKTKWNRNPIKKLVYLLLRQPESCLAGKKFECEQNKYLKLSKLYVSQDELMNDRPYADVYMTGSDQVWGPTEDGSYDSSYCLSFVPDSEKKIAYAASFGHTDMTEELSSYYKKWLRRYEHIAVREDSALNFLNTIDIEAQQVVDPTLLLTREEWEKYVGEKIEKKYVLVYQLHNDKRLGEYAQKVAKEKGLPLLRVSASLHQITRPGKFIWCPSIKNFLSYVKNAECMITDSFHGTAFAINFNTPFVEVLPNNNTGTRNMSILRLTGLSNRILKDDDVNLAMTTIDFSETNRILEKKREESIEILKHMLE